MSIFRKASKDATKTTGNLVGSMASANAQSATNAAVDGMDLFRWKMSTPIIQNGHFDQQKGNLFEYIEAAKFNTDAASKGMSARAVVTDQYDPSAAADILIKDGGRVRKEVQAKFVKSHGSNGKENSAAKSVFDQAGGQKHHWGKYKGMDKLIRKDENYNADGSMLKEAKKIAKHYAKSGDIYASEYEDVYDTLTDELHYDKATSGGTTFEEAQKAYAEPEKYAKSFERKAVRNEMKCTASNMAKASFVTTGIVSGVTNMFDVFQDRKELADALCDVGADAVKGGSALLSDSMAATVMAGGIIDGGVALYSYACGEIDEEQLKEQLVDTTAKAATTIYFTKAVGAIMGSAVNPILPMAVYTTASYVVTCTREIIKNANLNAEEYDRMTAILIESTREMNEYHEKFKAHVVSCERRQREMFDRFINTFEYNLETGENYDQALLAICQFADEAGIALQHVEFDDFSNAMRSKSSFVLK